MTFSSPPEPRPVVANYNVADHSFDVLFSRYLTPASLNRANWKFNIYGLGRQANPGVAASARHVRGSTSSAVVIGDPNTVSYTPPPFDVAASDGSPAPAFASYPLTYT